ncbi:MAG: ComEC/Rec2 family competence protein [bacterium]|nr:ComEC/Rec2 family competence protein [bacterium]
MSDRFFYAICFGFTFGVLLRSFISANISVAYFLGILALALVFLFIFISKNRWGIISGIFLLAFSLGILRFHVVDKSAPAVFESKVNQKTSFSGIIVDEPDQRENNQKLAVETKINENKTKILLTTALGQDFKYGDEITFSGKLEKPENFITDQGKNFDYINYLRKDGIFYVMSYGDVEILTRGNGNKIKSLLFSLKGKFLKEMNFAIPGESESLLMGGLILGEKSSFSQDLRQSFVDTGTIHIVALSGYNVTIVAEWFIKLFSGLPRNIGIGMGIFSILLFVLMTGGSSTAIRAGIMAILVLVARATGRNYDVARGLILAGLVMILFNPFILVYDVSFQLSFIATVAVIFFTPRIEKYFGWVTKKAQLRDVVSVTCAAYVFVLPFILYKMGNLSLVALPANILILPLIPLTMGLGFFAGLFGLIWYGFAVPVGFVSFLFLRYELAVVNFFSNFTYASLTIPNFPLSITLLIYVYFVYKLFGRNIKNFFTEP